MAAFRDLMIDIVGHCNARCPYCVTGARRGGARIVMSVERFDELLDCLSRHGAVSRESLIQLYCWAEPFLHPDVRAIIGALNTRGLRYALSTNGSIRVDFSREDVKGLLYFLVSMPGFSQSSYDRIHGFVFERIRDNVVYLARGLREAGFKGEIAIAFHVYQFNVHELLMCAEFAQEHGMTIRPSYAILNDWRLLQGWVNGTLDNGAAGRISEELFCCEIRSLMDMSPRGYACPQHDFLVINARGDVLTCCQVPDDWPGGVCGNMFTDDFDKIVAKKRSCEVCRDCLSSGLAYYINHSLRTPAFCEQLLAGRRRDQRLDGMRSGGLSAGAMLRGVKARLLGGWRRLR